MHGIPFSMRRACASASLVLLALMALSSSALAQTNVSGGITIDTDWTAAGSPYRVTGNVVVQTGSTLTIEPGVVVEVLDVNTEIEVRGTLTAVGTEVAPIVFRSDENTSWGQWEGLRFASSSSAQLQWVEIHNADYALEFESPTAANYDVRDTKVRLYQSRAINVVSGGTLTIAGIDATADAATPGTQYGVYKDAAGQLNISNSRFGYGEYGSYTQDVSATFTNVVFDHMTTAGVEFRGNVTGTYNLVVDNCTLYDNTEAVRVNRVSSSTRVVNVTLRDSIFGENGYVFRDTSSSSYPISFSFTRNVWWGGALQLGGTLGSNSQNLQYNALLADPENGDFAPTDRSPARYYSPTNPAGTLGAIPFAGAPTGDGVHGFWYVDRVFPFNSVTEVAGDIVITSGVTMTFEPNARLEMAARSDVMQGGLNPSRIELVVEGELQANGTTSRPVVLTSDAASPARGDWYGVILSAATEAFSVAQVEIGYAMRGVTLDNATNTVVEMNIHDCSEAGVWASGGSPNVLRTQLHDNGYGIRILDNANVDIDETNVFDNSNDGIWAVDGGFSFTIGRVYGNGGDGINVDANTTGTYNVSLNRVTVSNNGQDGIDLYRASSSTRVLNVTFRSSAATFNGQYGVRDSSSSSYPVAFTCQNSNWWGNGSSGTLNYTGISSVGTCVSWNPLYVDASARNYAPTRYSPHRGLGYLGSLIGADEYAGAIGPLYEGFLWEDQTFTAAGGPYQLLGDFYVPDGVTLTIEPGAEFVVANQTDGMGGGLSSTRTELRVLSGGTMLIGDEDGEPVHFRPSSASPSAGAWYGLRFDDASTSRVENTRIDYPQYGANIAGPRAPALLELDIRYPSSNGIYAESVTGSPDVDVLASQVIGTGTGTGVYMIDSSGEIRSSYITHTSTGILVSANTSGTYNAYVINNTLVHQGTGISYNRASSSTRVLNIWVENNVIAGSTSRAITDTSSTSYSTTDTVRNNNYFGNSSVSGSFNVNSGNITTNPLIEDDDWDSFPRWWDGKLWAESLAINAGNSSAARLPSRDITGRARNFSGGVDIGAWEFDPAANREPRADAATASRMVPYQEVFSLDGSGALDPDGFIASAFWTMSDGTVTPGQSVEHTFNSDGAQWAYLTIIDDDGAEDHAKVDLNVNRRPVANAGPAVFQDIGEIDPFDGTASFDTDGTLVSYLWDFGDGTSASGAEVLHSYTEAGTYLVTLTVTDNEGLTATDTTVATVFGLTDAQGPLVSHVEIGNGQSVGVPVVINATIADASGVASAVLNYRPLGSSSAPAFITMSLVDADSSLWRATIPGAAVASPGVEYWIEAIDTVDTPGPNFTRTPIDALTGGAWDFTVNGDPDPPVITHTEIADGQTNGEAVTVSATVTDATGVDEVQLFFRVAGASTFGAVPMTNVSGNLWTAQIPGFVVTEPGVEYYITATDTSPSPNTARAPAGAPATLYDFVVGSGDTTPPLIAHTPVTDGQPSGVAVPITAGVADSGGVASVSVFYRPAGGVGAFAEAALSNTGGTNWAGSIPALAVNAPGVEYYVSALDDADNQATDPSGAPASYHSFTVSDVDDAAPVITHTPVADGQAEGATVVVSATITDASTITSATLWYRVIGYPFFASVALSNTSGDTWEASIPGFSVAAPGMEYYLRATDSAGNTAVDPAGAPGAPYSFGVGDADAEGPTVAHTPIADGQTVGADVTVSAVVFDPSGVGTVMLQYRTIGAGSFTGVEMLVATGSTYEATIPGAAVTAAGVEYYLHAVDGSPDMNETFDPATAPTAGHTFTTTVPDTTGPVITHTPPTSVTFGDDLTLSMTVTDASGVATVSVFWALDVGGFTEVSATALGGGNYTAVVPAGSIVDGTGSVRYYVVATDSAGNSTTRPAGGAGAPNVVTVTYPDTVAPALTHTPVAELVYGTDLAITATATDETALDGVTLYWALDAGGFVSQAMIPTGGDGFRTTVAASLITDGTATVRYYLVARDAAGNTTSSPVAGAGAPHAVTVTYPDVTGPTVSFPTPGTQTVGVGFDVSITASDDDSGVASVSLFYRASGDAAFSEVVATGSGPYLASVPGSAVREPSIELYAEAVDAAGNATQSSPVSVAVEPPADNVPPTIDLSEVPDNQAAGIAVTVSADVTDASGVDTVTLWYRVSGVGAYTAVEMTSDGGSTFAADIPDGSVTVAGVQYYVSATDLSPLANEAVAPAGAPATPASFTVTPTDTAAPTIAHTPAAGPLVAGNTHAVTATITDGAGVASATLFWRTVGGAFSEVPMARGAGTTWTATIPVVAAPGVEYYLRAEDILGNAGTLPLAAPGSLFSITVQVPNELPPSIVYTPITARQEPGAAVVFSATITDTDGVASARLLYRTSGDTSFRAIALANTAGDTWSVTLGGPAIAQPGVEYYLEATDAAGAPLVATLPAAAPADVYAFDVGFGPVDSTPPSISHTPPSGPFAPGAALPIQALVSDDSGVASVVLQLRPVGDVAWLSVPMTLDSGNVWQGAIPALAMVDPGVEYYLVATDASPAANLATSPAGAPAVFHTVEVVTPDTTGPAITLDAVPSPQPEGGDVIVTATITDPSDVASATLYYAAPGVGSFGSVGMTALGGDRFQGAIPAAAVVPGRVRYYVGATDGEGNSAVAPAGSPGSAAGFDVEEDVVPDTTAPVIVHTPTTDVLTPGTALSVSADITDDSGVLSVTLYVRTSGDTAWLTAAASRSGDTFTAMVPSILVAAPGVEYYLEAVDRAPAANTATSPAGAPTTFHSVTVEVPDTAGPTLIVDEVASPQVAGTPVPFGAEATDPAGVASVTLWFRIGDGAWESLAMAASTADQYGTTLDGARVVPGTIAWYVEAEDALGNTSTSPAEGAADPLVFTVEEETGPDTTPPSILHTPLETVQRDDAVVLSAVVTDATGVALVQVYAREVGEPTFMSFDLTDDGDNTWSVEVPAGVLEGDAFEYYLSATDAAPAVNTATVPEGAPDDVYTVTIEDNGGDAGGDAGGDTGSDAGGDAGGDAGTPDAGGDAGAPDAGDDSGTSDTGDDVGAPDVSELDGGSGNDGSGGKDGCSASGAPAPGVAWLALVGLVLGVRRRRIMRR